MIFFTRTVFPLISAGAQISAAPQKTVYYVKKVRHRSQYFRAFGLNTERCELSLRIQSECGKIGTRKNSVFGHFSCSETNQQYLKKNNFKQCNQTKEINPICNWVSPVSTTWSDLLEIVFFISNFEKIYWCNITVWI